MKALILAAGQGTRLKHLTYQRPKPMLPVRHAPLLQHTIEWLRSHGVHDIVINLHYRPEVIVNHFGDGSQYEVALSYSYESQLLGTAGAAKQLESFLDDTFVVIYGDVYTNLNLTRLAAQHATSLAAARAAMSRYKGCMTMSLYQVSNPEECGLVATNRSGRVTRFIEKPPLSEVFTRQAFSGVLICEPEVLDFVPGDVPFDFGHDLIPKLLSARVPMYGVPLNPGEFLIDIGTLRGYLRALSMAKETASLQV